MIKPGEVFDLSKLSLTQLSLLFRQSHQRSDVDSSGGALHHKLGKGPTNAAPGNHEHFKECLIAGKNSAQTLLAGVTTVISMNTIKFATEGDLVLDTGTVTVKKTGWYQVSGNITFAASTSSARRILWVAKGTVPGVLTNFIATNIVASAQDASNITALSVSTLVFLSAGEVVGLAGQADVNYALDLSQNYMSNLSVHLVN